MFKNSLTDEAVCIFFGFMHETKETFRAEYGKTMRQLLKR
ncbi:Hypothetical protein CulFRC58_0609 [Corynebacterium ulcerans FRC58]|uniref:Transposase n=1 Tax=Corynebacterium ulcerans FRC58 TaxID=1408268 RepID=A0ABM5TZI9_CORUL|nr:Hypothetical protein CulFRC58_0609 [Corynebacterium ulcerans FRC58]